MPVGTLKNTLYCMALPVLGRPCGWKPAKGDAVEKALHDHHAAGACVQRFEAGRLTRCHAVGFATEERRVTEETVFRTASVAKMVTALLVFRLQTQGKLDVDEDISALWGAPIRHPFFPQTPITLGMLLSHTSGIADSPAYFASFANSAPLSALLRDSQAFHSHAPGEAFAYSNLAAGLIGCLLEKRFGSSLEALAQAELFAPLNAPATFDVSTVPAERAADIWRVLPAGRGLDMRGRREAAQPIGAPDPEAHYLLASGNLYITAPALARLTLTAWNGADGFLNERSLQQMHTPLMGWPRGKGKMLHGMGLLTLDDASVCRKRLWGHQGFAYGAVNGVFFDAQGNGFACLNSGASEARAGHLALINRDLIRACWQQA